MARTPLVIAQAHKPFSQMTDEEIEAFSHEVVQGMAERRGRQRFETAESDSEEPRGQSSSEHT
jgi:hypothetical protein